MKSWKDKDGNSWGMEGLRDDMKNRFIQSYASWERNKYQGYAGPINPSQLVERLAFLDTLEFV